MGLGAIQTIRDTLGMGVRDSVTKWHKGEEGCSKDVTRHIFGKKYFFTVFEDIWGQFYVFKIS